MTNPTSDPTPTPDVSAASSRIAARYTSTGVPAAHLPPAVEPGPLAAQLFQAVCNTLAGVPNAGEWVYLPAEAWPLLPGITDFEGVGPLLFTVLRRGSTLPLASLANSAPAIQALGQQYYNTAAQNTLFHKALLQILAAFQSAGVQPLLLKGAALAFTHFAQDDRPVYLDPALRPMVDLDFLVRLEQRGAALEALESLGYTDAEPETVPGLAQHTLHAAYYRGGPANRVGVELHWNLIAGPADERTVPSEWFWAQARPAVVIPDWVNSCGVQPQILTPTAHLLYLVGHQGLRHPDYLRLLWLYDIHLLLVRHWIAVRQAGAEDRQDTSPNHSLLDWDTLAQQALALGWGPALAAVLSEVQACFGSPLPPGFLERLPGPRLDPQPAFQRTRTQHTWDELRRLAPLARIQAIFALLFPAPSYMRWRYQKRPAGAFPPAGSLPLILAYPYRWFDMAADLARTLIKKARRR